MKRMYGIIVPMITPIKPDGSVDYESVESLSDYLVQKGVNCLYPCGTTGAFTYLTVEEREKVVESTIKGAKGRVNVFAQVGGGTTADAVRLAKHAVSAGADGIGLLTPTYYPLTDDEMEAYYLTVSKAVPSDYPIYMYSIPGLAINNMRPDLAKRIAEKTSNIIGMKYSVGSIVDLQRLVAIKDGTFDVMTSSLQMFHAAMSVGCKGIVSGVCHAYPEKMAVMYKSFVAGDIAKSLEISREMFPLVDCLAKQEMAKCYWLMNKNGAIRHNALRAPMMPITPETEASLTEALKGYHAN